MDGSGAVVLGVALLCLSVLVAFVRWRGVKQAMPDGSRKRQLPQYSLEEVAKHNSPEDLWVIIDGKIIDVTKYQKFHPGGEGVRCRELFCSACLPCQS